MSTGSPLRSKPETAFFLVGAMVSVVLLFAGPTIDEHSIAILLAVAVILAGLPHGALDAWVARRAALWETWRGAAVFHLLYVAAAAAVIAAWWFAPGLSLLLFLVLSAWHFAGDWHLPAPLRALVGAALLALPAWHWPDEVTRVFGLLGGREGMVLASMLHAAGPLLGAALGASALLALRRSPATTVELVVLAVLALLLPPLLYFVLYFCGLHSPRHLRLVAAQAGPSMQHRLVIVAVLYTGLTLAAAALAWPWLAGAAGIHWSEAAVRAVFIGLAALTVPHMVVIAISERRRGKTPWA